MVAGAVRQERRRLDILSVVYCRAHEGRRFNVAESAWCEQCELLHLCQRVSYSLVRDFADLALELKAIERELQGG